MSSTDQENLIFHILALPVHGAKYQFLVSIMNEEIDHTQTLSSATGSASFNKRSNFQFTYDSETNLLFLIHKYKEDIFTRGNIIKTWEKVLQEFNERCNSNIVQSRTINHRFQMLKKNLENRLKHNNQLLDQVVLNENEKLLVDILEYMYKNNHTEVNPYSLGGSSNNSDVAINTQIDNSYVHQNATTTQIENPLALADMSQISPNSYEYKLNRDRAQYLMSQGFDNSIQHQFQNNMDFPNGIRQHQLVPSSGTPLLGTNKDIVAGYVPSLEHSELINPSNQISHAEETMLQPHPNNQASSHIIYKSPDINMTASVPQNEQHNVQHPLRHSNSSTSAGTLASTLQPQQQLNHESKQHFGNNISPNIQYDNNPNTRTSDFAYRQDQNQNHEHQQQYQTQLQQDNTTESLLKRLIVSQSQVAHSINALREDLQSFKSETNQKFDRLISDYSLQQDNSMNKKLDSLIRILRSQNLKNDDNSSSPTDEDMTNEHDSSYGAEQATSTD